ncbi:MAG: AGE family epimerase/isomerase [Roseinatronobacter sp.]
MPPLSDPAHRAALQAQAAALIAFFRPSLNAQGGFDLLDYDGQPIPDAPQELHTTTRLVHSYALAQAYGAKDCAPIIEAGMAALMTRHRDTQYGGFVWSFGPNGVVDGTKLAYGHVFVLLAASSARQAGHDGAPALLAEIDTLITQHYWDEGLGRLCDEYTRDWQPFSTYRGMNANMHGAEAFLAAFETAGEAKYLHRAGRILDFFTAQMAPQQGWRIPEHYTAAWQIDPDYEGNPMFRPAGTTPGHALEFARLLLQHWDLAGRRDETAIPRARALVATALADGWLADGAIAYTVAPSGQMLRPARYWWPMTEALGALAALMKADPTPQDALWYDRVWQAANARFIDHARGGWYPEINADGAPALGQFKGKPDIYHALQAMLFPLAPGLSRPFDDLRKGV